MKLKIKKDKYKNKTIDVIQFIVFTFMKDQLFMINPSSKIFLDNFNISDVLTGLNILTCSIYDSWENKILNAIKNIKSISDYGKYRLEKTMEYSLDYNQPSINNKIKKNTIIDIEYYNEYGKLVTSKKVNINKFKYLVK